MKNKIIRIMAYVYMPFLFMLLGYALIYIAAAPGVRMLDAAGEMVLSKEIPNFNQQLKSIYRPYQNTETIAIQQGNGNNDSSSTDNLQDASTENSASEDATTAYIASPNYSIPVSIIQFPEQGTHFAQLSCESIGLDAPVFWGDTNEILRAGVGQFMGSFLPGFDRSILLSAHNTTFFKPLKLINEGDVVTLRTNYGAFSYEVKKVEVIPASEAKQMLDDMLSYDEEKLIMYTCYPFETLVGTKTDRLFVFADKISGPTVK